MLLVQAMFQLMNNRKNNGNIVVVIVEMFIEVDNTMELQTKIIIVVVRIITINNSGEDHVSFISYPQSHVIEIEIGIIISSSQV